MRFNSPIDSAVIGRNNRVDEAAIVFQYKDAHATLPRLSLLRQAAVGGGSSPMHQRPATVLLTTTRRVTPDIVPIIVICLVGSRSIRITDDNSPTILPSTNNYRYADGVLCSNGKYIYTVYVKIILFRPMLFMK